MATEHERWAVAMRNELIKPIMGVYSDPQHRVIVSVGAAVIRAMIECTAYLAGTIEASNPPRWDQ